MEGIFFIFGIIVCVVLYKLDKKINGLDAKVSSFVAGKLSVMPGLAEKDPGKSVDTKENMKEEMIQRTAEKEIAAEKSFNEEAGGRWLGKIGAIALLLGVSFFLKYSFDNWIGPAGQVMIGLLIGVGMIALGQYLREKYLRYSDVLMGGGIGILYLCIFTASTYYTHYLISKPVAFFFMICVTILSVIISIANDTATFAVLGAFGGFATPVLCSTGQNAMVALFSYIALLDLGILALTVFRKWMALNFLGFVGTVVLFGGWFAQYYTQAQLPETMFFLTLFFVIYLVTAVIHNVYRQKKSDEADLLLTTVNAAFYMGVSYYILNPQYEALMGYFAVVLALVYFVVSYMANEYNPEDQNLNFYLPGISAVFLTIAIPLQFSGYWITLAWLAESLVLYYVAFALGRQKMQTFGAIVYTIGLVRLITYDLQLDRLDIEKFNNILNRQFALIMIAAGVGFAISYLYRMYSEQLTLKNLSKVMIVFAVVANLLVIGALSFETTMYYEKQINALEQQQSGEAKKLGQYFGPGQKYSDAEYVISEPKTIQKITSRGQITLPSYWRKQFKTNQIVVKNKNGSLEISPFFLTEHTEPEYTVFDAIRDNKGKGLKAKDLLKILSK